MPEQIRIFSPDSGEIANSEALIAALPNLLAPSINAVLSAALSVQVQSTINSTLVGVLAAAITAGGGTPPHSISALAAGLANTLAPVVSAQVQAAFADNLPSAVSSGLVNCIINILSEAPN